MLRSTFGLALLVCSPVLAQAPCFDNNLGTLIPLFDDEVSPPQTLGFTFPGPAGPVTTIGISSNGFVWLDGTSTDSRCCFGNESQFLSDPPSIAVGWMDLLPPAAAPGDGVFFNTTAASAVVKWRNVPEFGSANPPNTYQLQMFPTGEFIITHLTNLLDWHDQLVGVTGGNNATANPVDFLQVSTTPVNTGTNATVHETFTTFPTSNYDISGRSFHFLPNGIGGYVVVERTQCRAASVSVYGNGCPSPLVVYEQFPTGTYDLSNTAIDFVPNGGGYTVFAGTNGYLDPTRPGSFAVNIGLWDDEVSAPQVMQFPFSYPGGTTNTVEISSNGLVYLQPGVMQGNALCCDGDAQTFATLLSPAIAPFWQDLDPSSGGGVYVEHNPQNNAFLVTWYNVPEFFTPSSSNTIQLALFSSGAFQIRSQAGSNVNHIALVGFTAGNAPAVPNGVDFTAAMPFATTGGGAPLTLAPAPGSLPQINTTFVMDITAIPSSATLGFMVLSFGAIQNGIDLTPLGMQGCSQYVTLTGAATFAFPVTPPGAQFQLTIPNNAAFVGVDVFGQCASLPTTATAIGVNVSNGIRISVGS